MSRAALYPEFSIFTTEVDGSALPGVLSAVM
jgi:hypothetical protein